MKNFLLKNNKIHPIPVPLDPSSKDEPESPLLHSAMLPLDSNTPKLSKKFSLQSQSFSPRPILKRKSGNTLAPKNSIDRKTSFVLDSSPENKPFKKKNSQKLGKIYPETPEINPEEALALKKTLKRKEKLAELQHFEVKFNGQKLVEKMRKFSIKRSNSTRKDIEKKPIVLKRPSDGVLWTNKADLTEKETEKEFEDPLFKVETKIKEENTGSKINFMEGSMMTKRLKTRKPRVNYRLKYDEKYKHIKYVIFPDDPFRTKWDILVLCFLIYSAIILPFITAFIDEEILDPFFFLDLIMDAVFFIDVVVNLFSAFDKEDILITSHWKIFLNYLKGWLFIDLISSLPLDLIMENSSNLNGFIRIAKLPRLYKLLKLSRLIRILKIIKERNKILRYFSEIFKMNTGLQRVSLAILLIMIFCHIFACLWFVLNDLESELDYEIWLYKNNLQDLGIMDLYLASLYFTVQTVVTVGYGDLHCYSTYERLFASGLMLIGVFVYSFAIGSLTSLISSLDQKNANYNKSMGVLIQIQKEYRLNTELFVKIKNHLKYGQNYEKNHKKLIEELPVSLRTEIVIKIYQEVIVNIPFLKNKPSSFISFLCPLLKKVKISKGDFIFMKNDPAEEMFFIKSGKVAAVFPKYDNFRFLKIKPGYYFGELDILFYSNIRRYTFMATQDSEFFILSRRHFKKIFLLEFRDIGEEFVQDAYLRKKRTKKIYLEALAACKANFRMKKPEKINSNHNSPKHSNEFVAKESIYNLNRQNLGFGFNAEKLLLKKSFELQKEKENKVLSSLRKENDYFFKEEILDNPEENPIKIKEDSANIPNLSENSQNLKDSLIENIENSQNIKDSKTENFKNSPNFNLKLIINHEDSNVYSNNKNKDMPLGPLPTPLKKSLAAYTFQKVLNINKMTKRINLGDNLRKSAEQEALKDKIKFFTNRINKMDQDINNLIGFSKQLQEKYQDKIEALKPKPIPPPFRRKLVKIHTFSHINFQKADSIKKKLNKLTQNAQIRRKSDTTTAQSFLANLKTLEKPFPRKKSTEDLKKKTLKIPENLLHLKSQEAFLKNRRCSLDVGRKLERVPSIIFKIKESLLEEGSLVSHEEQNLRDSMVKIKEKINVSKNILNTAIRRGSEMLSYRGSKSPKGIIGKNIFNNRASPYKKEKETFSLQLKPLRRTGSRRKSDQFVDLLKGFQRNESGFFIENTNKSVRKLSKKATLNLEDDSKNKKKHLKKFRRNSENFKSSFLSKILKNSGGVAKFTNKASNSSEDNSKSLTPIASKQTLNMKNSSNNSSEISSKNSSLKSSKNSSVKSIIKSSKKSSMKSSEKISKKDSNKFSMSYLSEEIGDNKKSFNNLELLDEEEIVKGAKSLEGEEKQLLEDIEGIEDIWKKNEEKGKGNTMKQIGKLKFVVDLASSPKKK